ncbi:phosphotriesterase family protein [Chitinophaga barathri]|uniref:Phosphotriesterase n=1 Tax=Chitinophaga barathri TaxID=1647451 RepID=A0A3N4MI76_9BACT|nr:phosphotriesterase [Chitinophaga barathri]RPD43308.1 phosphotriesterase [Chitinophaga barathri]
MTLSRRHFLTLLPAALGAGVWLKAAAQSEGSIMTVTGAISPYMLGPVLPHEHIMVDFAGADKITPGRYQEEEVFNTVLPYLKSLRAAGCKTMGECTPNFLGRDPLLLKRLSIASGLTIITNTGLYGAGAHKYLPAYVQTSTAEELAAMWIKEFRDGIGDTDIRPGFIKSGVDKGPLTESQRKLVHAAALTNKETGLAIWIHTGDGAAALEEAEIIQSNGGRIASYTWVHAQNEKDLSIHEKLAKAGAFISLDGLSQNSAEDYISRLSFMKNKGLLQQVLLSHDAGWYHVGEPGGGKFRDYNFLWTSFIPMLKEKGFTEEDIRRLTVINPSRALTIHPPARKLLAMPS